MALVTVTRTINQRTGIVTNTVGALGATSTITGVVLRSGIQAGVERETGTLTTAAGTLAQIALIDTDGGAVIISGQGPIDGTTLVTDINGDVAFTFNANRTQINVVRGAGDPALTVEWQVYDSDADNLGSEIKIRPTNVTATVTETVNTVDYTTIVLKNGPQGGFTQSWVPQSATGLRVNDAVEAVLTT